MQLYESYTTLSGLRGFQMHGKTQSGWFTDRPSVFKYENKKDAFWLQRPQTVWLKSPFPPLTQVNVWTFKSESVMKRKQRSSEGSACGDETGIVLCVRIRVLILNVSLFSAWSAGRVCAHTHCPSIRALLASQSSTQTKLIITTF